VENGNLVRVTEKVSPFVKSSLLQLPVDMERATSESSKEKDAFQSSVNGGVRTGSCGFDARTSGDESSVSREFRGKAKDTYVKYIP
jgi:hypothetical protein